MTILQQFGVPLGGKPAILAKLPTHLFRLDIQGSQELSECVETFSVNLVKKEIDITLYEAVDCRVYPVIFQLLTCGSLSICLEILNNIGEVSVRTFYHDAKLIDHSFEMTYCQMGHARHKITMSFKTTDIK